MINSHKNMFLHYPNKEPFSEVTGISVLEVKRLEILIYLYIFADNLSDPYINRISILCSFAMSLTFHLFSLT